ncbi:MAG: DUF5050 domain-containing protein [Lachnospiraceae bacterium]|nr:DUF5050 domain-containing protein [Lachnospiraceae bacterium]
MTKAKSHKARNVVLVIIIAIAVILLLILIKMSTSIALYDDPNTRGNTSGNLLNGGKFCESDGKIYFSNPRDEGSLYVMDDDLKNAKKLHGDSVSYLNVSGKYIFYTRRNDKKTSTGDAVLSLSKTGLFRLQTDGKKLGTLYDDPTQSLCLYGNFVYYQHYDRKKGLQLNAAKIDGSSDEMLLDEGVAPYSVEQGTIYYTGYDKEHWIHSMNINGTDQKVLYDGNCTSLIRQGDHLYFMDMERDYALVRTELDGSDPQILVADRLATYNVDEKESTVYYQVDDGENNGLYAMDLNGGKARKIADGDYNYIHIVGDYLIYEDFEGTTMYVMDLATEQKVSFEPPIDKK